MEYLGLVLLDSRHPHALDEYLSGRHDDPVRALRRTVFYEQDGRLFAETLAGNLYVYDPSPDADRGWSQVEQ